MIKESHMTPELKAAIEKVFPPEDYSPLTEHILAKFDNMPASEWVDMCYYLPMTMAHAFKFSELAQIINDSLVKGIWPVKS